MGQSLEGFKKGTLLVEIVKELFDSTPFTTSFSFAPSQYATIETQAFRDPLGNEIVVYFTEVKVGIFEVEFSVEGDSYQIDKSGYTVKDYSRLLSTVAQAISKFLEKYQPQGLLIKGTDIYSKVSSNSKTIGQKDRLYLYYISQIKDQGQYMVDKSNPEGIVLMKK